MGRLKSRPCWEKCLWPCVYFLIAVCALGALTFLCVYLIERFHLLSKRDMISNNIDEPADKKKTPYNRCTCNSRGSYGSSEVVFS